MEEVCNLANLYQCLHHDLYVLSQLTRYEIMLNITFIGIILFFVLRSRN